jgi:putative ABC transport system permease protein
MTKITMSFLIAIRGLWVNKMRSILTLLGMIIGIGAVITIVSLADGLKRQITGQVESLGSNLIWFWAQPSNNQRKEQGYNQQQGGIFNIEYPPITIDEIEEIIDNAPMKVKYSPVVLSKLPVKYESEKVFSDIYGVYAEYFSLSSLGLTSGEYFTEADDKGMTRICVIGSQTAKDLFGTKDPIHQMIKIESARFEVIGVLEEKGGGFGDQPDSRIYLPYTTAQRQLIKSKDPFFCVFQVTDFNRLEDFKEEVKATMNQIRKVSDPEDEQYKLQSQTDALKELSGIIKGMVYVFGGIAAVSLLVGGIGIMNIMLVTVTERTREIGLRKAVGAKKSDILMQFLIEAIVLCLIGGVMGMALGYAGAVGLSALISKSSPELTWEASLSPMVVIVAVGIATAIGLIFGVYPASNAAKLNPIDALRYE